MHIQNLTLENVKGVSGNFTLAPLTMIIGDNMVGKSAILAGLQLAVFGYLPHPRKEKMLPPMDLASTDKMSVMAVCSDGKSVEHHWFRSSLGSVTTKRIPDEPLAPAILMDAKSYFDLSAAKRTQFVFDCITLDGADPATLIADIANIRLEPHTADAEKALDGVLTTWRNNLYARNQTVPLITVQEWISNSIEAAKAKQLLAKQTVDRMAQTVRGLTELSVKNPADYDNDLATIDGQLQNCRTELANLQQERGRISGELTAFRNRSAQRSKAKEWADALPRGLAELEKVQATLAALEQQASVPFVRQECKKASSQAVEDITKQVGAQQDRLHQLQLKLQRAVNDVAVLKRQIHALAEKRDADLHRTSCPTCHRDWEPGWEQKIEDAYKAQSEPLFESVSKAEAIVTEHENSIRAEDTILSDLKQCLDEATRALASEQAEVAEHNNTILRLQNERMRLTNDIALHKEQIRTLEANIARCRENEQYLKDNPEESGADLTDQYLNVTSKISDANSHITELDMRRNQAVADRASLIRQMQAKTEHDIAVAEVSIWKASLEKALEFQQKMVDGAFGKLMGIANRFTDGILDAPLEYRDGDIGRMRQSRSVRDGATLSRWVPIDQFSGTEHAISYAGMCVALAAQADFKLVIVDELTRVRGARKRDIALRMKDLIDHSVIDQFVGVDVCEDDGSVPAHYRDFHIIHLK